MIFWFEILFCETYNFQIGPATFDDEFASEFKGGEEASGGDNVVTSSDHSPEPTSSSNIADISPPTGTF